MAWGASNSDFHTVQDTLDVTLDQALERLMELRPHERVLAVAGVAVGRDRAIREGRDLVAQRVALLGLARIPRVVITTIARVAATDAYWFVQQILQ